MRGAWWIQASTSSERCNCTWPLCLKQAPISHYQADLPANQWLCFLEKRRWLIVELKKELHLRAII